MRVWPPALVGAPTPKPNGEPAGHGSDRGVLLVGRSHPRASPPLLCPTGVRDIRMVPLNLVPMNLGPDPGHAGV